MKLDAFGGIPADNSSIFAQTYLRFLLRGNERAAMKELHAAVSRGERIVDIYETILAPALYELGRLWHDERLGIVEQHVCTAVIERHMGRLIDLAPAPVPLDLCVLSTTLERAEHHIGARMIADIFLLSGWNAEFAGCNLPVDAVLSYIDRVSIDVLALSATTSRDVAPVRRLIDALIARPCAPVVIVGGRAFAEEPALWREVGADGYAASPAAAVAIANGLVSHLES